MSYLEPQVFVFRELAIGLDYKLGVIPIKILFCLECGTYTIGGYSPIKFSTEPLLFVDLPWQLNNKVSLKSLVHSVA